MSLGSCGSWFPVGKTYCIPFFFSLESHQVWSQSISGTSCCVTSVLVFSHCLGLFGLTTLWIGCNYPQAHLNWYWLSSDAFQIGSLLFFFFHTTLSTLGSGRLSVGLLWITSSKPSHNPKYCVISFLSTELWCHVALSANSQLTYSTEKDYYASQWCYDVKIFWQINLDRHSNKPVIIPDEGHWHTLNWCYRFIGCFFLNCSSFS